MEEQVGTLWHRLITRLADDRHPAAAVPLEAVRRKVALLFRALGGDGGLAVEEADATAVTARRGWLKRLAGSDGRVELAWRDQRALRLPSVVDAFPDPILNAELYLWLAALAAAAERIDGEWFVASQRLTRDVLAHLPGLHSRYRRLVEAHLATRPQPDRLPPAEARREQAIRDALQDPGSVARLPDAAGAPHPVPLWLHPSPPAAGGGAGSDADAGDGERSGAARDAQRRGRRQAERVERPDGDRGLVSVRMENLLSWGEFAHVDRTQEDEEDLARAEAVADDLNQLAVARDRRAVAARLRFDLDLPAAASDDLVLGPGVLLPEWDWRRARLRAEHCRIEPMLAADAPPQPLPEHLRATAQRLRRQFQLLAPARRWQRAQPDGAEIDLDAYLRFATERAAGHGGGDRLYRQLRADGRALSCLLLADLSLSTDSWIDDRRRVIDVIRDSLYLFAESLAASGDRFAIHGFSSRRRDPVRVHTLKAFDEPYGAIVRGRIDAIRPGYYTRIGAAIRYATRLLQPQGGGRRLLLLLTDGKPNDLDQYEGRYGIEDTREAVREARRAGLEPFCVTIDRAGNDYLPHLFGGAGYVVIHRPSELPSRLPLLYARMAG